MGGDDELDAGVGKISASAETSFKLQSSPSSSVSPAVFVASMGTQTKSGASSCSSGSLIAVAVLVTVLYVTRVEVLVTTHALALQAPSMQAEPARQQPVVQQVEPLGHEPAGQQISVAGV